MSRSALDWPALMQTCRRVLDALDWPALGEIYFHWGGERFWQERRPAVLARGKELAQALLRQLPRGGSSLWVGAGVAELPVLLAEVALHGRSVVAANLRARECEVLNAGLREVAPELAVHYLPLDAREVEPTRTFDHLGCISVFTDPETWPVVSDVAYGRIAPVQLDVERFVAERAAVAELATALFARVQRPGLITTSAEEAAWFLDAAAKVAATVEAGDEMIETAVVGDPVGVLRVR
jgi:hypothetical protein